MVEFTGERVVPGQVNADLWNEHLARYAFARRFADPQALVLDVGCGTGYGAAELAQAARTVIGFDLSPDAASFATATYPLRNIAFASASADLLPFRTAAFDLVVAFEVIEHLPRYRDFIHEAARVLRPEGHFIVSTPNRLYYAESREQTGPNPYHEHEFEAEEFFCELQQGFQHVSLLAQNHVDSFAFHPLKTFSPADARIDGGAGSAADAHFFIAICSHSALPEIRSFSYVPKAGNILREREQHVKLLQTQLRQARQERDDLLTLYRKQNVELEERNRWAAELNRQLERTGARVIELQEEIAREAEAYENKVRELDAENIAKTEWAQQTESRLTAEIEQYRNQLSACVQLLHDAEALAEERTAWAQRADAERENLSAQLNAARASRWLKLGRRLGLGPAL
ncbi:MAG: methyltransferase domain-containing protein [Acidobacteriaceae bacterium]|nr:methyltransferase domain-containing protein [Acidobacteriaceae bacterium]